MSEVLTLELPMPPNLANSRMHWRTKHRKKLEYWAWCDVMTKRRPPAVPFARVTLSSVMHLGAAMDEDNAMARHKWALDWLTERRYIADDRRQCLAWAGFPTQIVKRTGHYTLVLTLTPRN